MPQLVNSKRLHPSSATKTARRCSSHTVIACVDRNTIQYTLWMSPLRRWLTMSFRDKPFTCCSAIQTNISNEHKDFLQWKSPFSVLKKNQLILYYNYFWHFVIQWAWVHCESDYLTHWFVLNHLSLFSPLPPSRPPFSLSPPLPLSLLQVCSAYQRAWLCIGTSSGQGKVGRATPTVSRSCAPSSSAC